MYTNSIICKIYKHIKIWKYFLKSLESLKSFLLIFYNSIEMIKIITEILLAADECIILTWISWQKNDREVILLYFSIFALFVLPNITWKSHFVQLFYKNCFKTS